MRPLSDNFRHNPNALKHVCNPSIASSGAGPDPRSRQRWIRTTVDRSQRIYSPPHLTTLASTSRSDRWESNPLKPPWKGGAPTVMRLSHLPQTTC